MFQLNIYLLIICVLFFSIDTKSQEYENVELLYQWSEDSLVGSESFDNVYNEIWGITTNGREYAIIGSTAGTHFFDLTDSNSISEVAFVAGRVQGSEIIHRDYHDFKNLLYAVSDEGQSSLQIIDFSTLPDSVSLVYDSSELFQRSHNIFIDTATAKLYTTNGDIYSLENPLDPILIYNTSLLSCHDMYVQNDTAYINGGYDGFFVVDFSQTTPENQNHQVLGSLPTYPDQGYNHSGWLTADGNYYVMADETWGMRMKMLDISDFSNIEVISLFGSEVDSNSIPHNQIIRGDYLYTAYYHDGLYVHDISEPSQPILLAYYDTFLPNHHDSYMGAWGVYPFLPSGKILLSDMQTGLYVFTVTYDNPLNIEANFSNDISLFPNPANEFLTIANTHSIYNSMQLIDINGKSVFKSDLIHQNHKLDISKYSPGIYSLRLRGKHKSKSIKLIIE